MKKPVKYNWFALFSMTFLALAIFFVVMTGWHAGRMNDLREPDSAMAGQASSPDWEKSPVGMGDFTSDGRAGVRSGKPGTEDLKPANPDSLAILADASAEYWRDLLDTERDTGVDTTRAFTGNIGDRPGKKLNSDGGKGADPGVAAGSKGKEGDKLVSLRGTRQVRVEEMTDDQAVSH
jgi:hypothetical protein